MNHSTPFSVASDHHLVQNSTLWREIQRLQARALLKFRLQGQTIAEVEITQPQISHPPPSLARMRS